MKEPEKVEEAEAGILLQELVDLACASGSLVRGPLHDYKKLAFYRSVVAHVARSRGGS